MAFRPRRVVVFRSRSQQWWKCPLLCSEVAVEHLPVCVPERPVQEAVWAVKLLLSRSELQPLGGESAREWPWVRPEPSHEPVARQAHLQLGVERWCELHRPVPLCPSELDCQSVHGWEPPDLRYQWFPVDPRWESSRPGEPYHDECHEVSCSLVVQSEDARARRPGLRVV